jgi:GrpB-like predicted nucleotidyltransferase (UPF0157 family)
MADAPIEIVEYDPQWPARFGHEQALLCQSLARWLVGAPEHIGSTAVPGLAAKPVIDIMAPVHSLKSSFAAIPVAERAGYVYFPYRPGFMHWFCKPSAEYRTHHLHLVPFGGRLWRERLAFRDALRADEALRREYQALKLGLAAEFPRDREAYTEAKSPFIARVVRAALGIDGGVAEPDAAPGRRDL